MNDGNIVIAFDHMKSKRNELQLSSGGKYRMSQSSCLSLSQTFVFDNLFTVVTDRVSESWG